MDTAIILVKQTVIMFALILFGVFLFKKGVFSKRGGKQLSDFVISAVCPVLIFTSFQKELDEKLVDGLLTAFAMATAAHIVLIVTGTVLFRRKNRGENYAIERYAVAYSNCAFLGIPLVSAVYGTEGVFYVTAYIALFNLLSWTHGVMTVSGNVSFKSLLNVVKSPAVIATAAGIVMFFTQIRLPEIVLEPLNYIASLNTPLAMVVSGIMIAQSDLKKAVKKAGIYLTCGAKLILGPILIMLVFMLFRADETVVNTMIIAASAPTAASTIMFANKYGGDGVYASEIFAVSTIMSVFTIPLMLMLSQLMYSLI
ncbi:MAG: AEC family transporter [Oscillospiraceae bacterium]|nr:AEC family transporter [Oscillospiraceae bacterium]